MQNNMKKKKRRGKAIRHFIVEVVDIRDDPEMNINPDNPYTFMSEEERYKDFIETFSLLWAESCREAVHKI